MRIKSVTIKNTKSFRDVVTVPFNDDYTILIGPNGGGKSNLIDIVTITLRVFLLQPCILTFDRDGYSRIQRSEAFHPTEQWLEKYLGDGTDSLIELMLEVGQVDLDNMKLILDNRAQLQAELHRFTSSQNLDFLDAWNLGGIEPGHIYHFSVENYALITGSHEPAQFTFRSYLQNLEFLVHLASRILPFKLKSVFMPIPAYRAIDAGEFKTTLSEWEDRQSTYFRSTSRGWSSFMGLATQYFAVKHRQYESNGDVRGFQEDTEVAQVTRQLEAIGYRWALLPINPARNTYEIKLYRGPTEFSVAHASSGEKELINFIFGIFALNVRGGGIVVDEPELHLHPQWQAVLLELFRDLHLQMDNQFLIATHSPAFVRPDTISNVTRVYLCNGSSRTIAIDCSAALKEKDLLHIVRSHNNEKLFFADRVVLVEGPTDRLVFSTLIDVFAKQSGKGQVVEVLEVHGKANFPKYQELLRRLEVRHCVIADRDYLLDVGDSSLRGLFETDSKAIDKRVLRHKKSQDRMRLVEALEVAMTTCDMEQLKAVLNYIKGRVSRIRSNLKPPEKESLQTSTKQLAKCGIFILMRGEIEDYLPPEARSLESIISLVAREDFLKTLVSRGNGVEELLTIVESILS
jgi:predicted ATPase